MAWTGDPSGSSASCAMPDCPSRSTTALSTGATATWAHSGARCSTTPGPRSARTPARSDREPSISRAGRAAHLSRSGHWTVCGIGIAYHAGAGSYPGLPTNNANPIVVGVEAENSGTEGWSPEQYWSYVRGVAAINREMGRDHTRAIGHKEWAAVQGKWDPAA
ncbi:hypothetical protein GS891_12435 [Rhodococcus hoagii]|nr:hypothetical protein [Prescottella equi]